MERVKLSMNKKGFVGHIILKFTGKGSALTRKSKVSRGRVSVVVSSSVVRGKLNVGLSGLGSTSESGVVL